MVSEMTLLRNSWREQSEELNYRVCWFENIHPPECLSAPSLIQLLLITSLEFLQVVVYSEEHEKPHAGSGPLC